MLRDTAERAASVIKEMQWNVLSYEYLLCWFVFSWEAFITKQKRRAEFGTEIFLNKCITNRFHESQGYETYTALRSPSRNWN